MPNIYKVLIAFDWLSKPIRKVFNTKDYSALKGNKALTPATM